MRKTMNFIASVFEYGFSIILLTFFVRMIINWNYFSSYAFIIFLGITALSVMRVLMHSKDVFSGLVSLLSLYAFSIFIAVYTEYLDENYVEIILEHQRLFPDREWTILLDSLPIGLRDVVLIYLNALNINTSINTDVGFMGICGYEFSAEYTNAIYEYKMDIAIALQDLRNIYSKFISLIIVLLIGGLVSTLIETKDWRN